MLKLFVKDNTNGCVHEYGTSCHDALILQEDGSLHYENMQCFGGTKYPEEGYSFCLADGTVPPIDSPEIEPYIDIAGEYYTKPKTNSDRIRATDDELATMLHAVKMGYRPWCDYHCENEGDDGCDNCIKKWLQQPAEGE